MTVPQCTECGGTVSTKADKCPHCGAPSPRSEVVPENDKPIGWDKLGEWYEREIDPQGEKRKPEQLGEVERRRGFLDDT